MKQYFLPPGDAARAQWLNNFAGKLSVYATKFSITPAEVADTTAGAAYFAAVINAVGQWRDYTKALTDHKNAVRDGVEPGATIAPPTPPTVALPSPAPLPGIFARAIALAGRIKSHIAYTEADGQNLGLEGAEVAGRNAEEAPALKLSLTAGGLVNVGWKKSKGTDSVEIQVDRGQGWAFLAVDSIPDYVDTLTLPTGQTAQWKYRAVYRSKDERTGDWSDVASIAVAG